MSCLSLVTIDAIEAVIPCKLVLKPCLPVGAIGEASHKYVCLITYFWQSCESVVVHDVGVNGLSIWVALRMIHDINSEVCHPQLWRCISRLNTKYSAQQITQLNGYPFDRQDFSGAYNRSTKTINSQITDKYISLEALIMSRECMASKVILLWVLSSDINLYIICSLVESTKLANYRQQLRPRFWKPSNNIN